MLAQRILQRCNATIGCRFISRSSLSFESKTTETVNKTVSSKSTTSSSVFNDSIIAPRTKNPSDFEKWLLVWVKKFPKGEVPEKVKEETIYQAKSRARIKAANYMIGIAILGCIYAAYSGKQAVKRGDTVLKRNQDWHQKINEEHAAKQKAES